MSRISGKSIQLLKGFKDILPEHQKYWNFLISQAEKIFLNYGFEKIDVPVLEESRLYIKGTGKHTDIVQKELYEFDDKNGERVALRPEFTPGICRAYIEHGMLNKQQPLKFYAFGPVFRHDNPQAGRLRQFHQFDLEVIGTDSPVADAQLIIIAYRFLESLGLTLVVHINSIGCSSCRAEYISCLRQYLMGAQRKKRLCENCRERYSKNPLRILDCKEEECQKTIYSAPQIVDFLCDECKKHFMAVLEQLDDIEIPYILDVRLVRGLDYYTRTTFEIYFKDQLTEENRTQSALAGGGRYDGLIELLGGRPTSAIGFAIGAERVISRMRDNNINVPEYNKPDVFVAQLGLEARKESFKLYERLLAENIKVGESFSQDGLKKQLEKADSLNVKFTLILGQREIIDKTIILRDMNSGIQEIINYDNIINEIKKRIKTLNSSIKSYMLADIKRDEKFEEKDVDLVKKVEKNIGRKEVLINGNRDNGEDTKKKEQFIGNRQPKYKLNSDDEENEKIINKF